MNCKVNLSDKLDQIGEMWSPKVVGELNGQYIKLVKLLGEYVWHRHDNEDELFLVIKGSMEVHLPNEVVTLQPGEFYIVPRGLEHKSVAREECQALLFEPATTRNTGNVDHRYTIEPEDLERL